MSKEELMKIQTCVLKVNIHCDGCKQKVKKILQKIEGVITVKVDSEQGKVTVTGSVDPSVLIKKLAKSGKHGEIWGAPKGNNNPNQLKGMQSDTEKGGSIKKGQKGGGGGGGGNSNVPKMGQQPNPQQMQQLEKMKGFQDLKLPSQLKGSVPVNKNQNQKGMKFDVPEDDDDDDDDLCDEFDDEFTDDDDDDDEFDDEFDDLPLPSNKMKPNKMKFDDEFGSGPAKNGGKGVPGGGNHNQSGGKNGGKNGGVGGGGGPNSGKKGNGPNGGGGPKAEGLLGPVQNLSMPMSGPMGDIPAVHGLPATDIGGAPPGYFQGSGLDPMQNQQYLTAVMNQQRAMGNERFQPMMYARPPPAVNYMPQNPHQYPNPYAYPYPYPPYGNDQYSYAFTDDNTSSCNIM